MARKSALKLMVGATGFLSEPASLVGLEAATTGAGAKLNAGFDAGASAFDSVFTGGEANENDGFDSAGCSAFFKSSSRAFWAAAYPLFALARKSALKLMVGAAEDAAATGAGAGDAGFTVIVGATGLIGETTVGFGAGVVFGTVVILVDATREMRTDSKSLAKLSSGAVIFTGVFSVIGSTFRSIATFGTGTASFCGSTFFGDDAFSGGTPRDALTSCTRSRSASSFCACASITAACVVMAFMIPSIWLVTLFEPPVDDDTRPLRMTLFGFGRFASRFAASSRSTEASRSAAISNTERISSCMFFCTSFNAGLNSRVSSRLFFSSNSSQAADIKLSNSLRRLSSDEFAAHSSFSRLRSCPPPSRRDSRVFFADADDFSILSMSDFPGIKPSLSSPMRFFVTEETSSNIASTSFSVDSISSSIAFKPSARSVDCSFACLISFNFFPQEGSGEFCKFTAGERVVSMGVNFCAIAVDHCFGLGVGVLSRISPLSSSSAVPISIVPALSLLSNSMPLSTGDFGVSV